MTDFLDPKHGRHIMLCAFMQHAIDLNRQGLLRKACKGRRWWRYTLAAVAMGSFSTCSCKRAVLLPVYGSPFSRMHLLLPCYLEAMVDLGYNAPTRA